MRLFRQIFLLLSGAVLLVPLVRLEAQVTTATLYGLVRDSTGAVLPGASVTATNQGTNLTRDTVTDERGEFALPVLPVGQYTLKIELPGFKTYTNQGLELGAGQTVRQTFALEVGQLSENITVSERTPLVATATATQQESLGTLEVNQLPLARRNLVGLMTLSPGVTENATGIAGGGNIRLNGVAEGGTAITVDGTDAVTNSETRGTGTYGGQNQISVMSIEAVAEVQIVKGILPAEYGGAAGGQVNILSRVSGNTVLPDWRDTLLYLNRAAFALVPTYPVTTATIRPGTANPSLVHGPGRWVADISLGKSFRLKEALSLQIRADAFNAFNHVNYSNPVLPINSPDFGKITSVPTGSWRTGQIGARLTF